MGSPVELPTAVCSQPLQNVDLRRGQLSVYGGMDSVVVKEAQTALASGLLGDAVADLSSAARCDEPFERVHASRAPPLSVESGRARRSARGAGERGCARVDGAGWCVHADGEPVGGVTAEPPGGGRSGACGGVRWRRGSSAAVAIGSRFPNLDLATAALDKKADGGMRYASAGPRTGVTLGIVGPGTTPEVLSPRPTKL